MRDLKNRPERFLDGKTPVEPGRPDRSTRSRAHLRRMLTGTAIAVVVAMIAISIIRILSVNGNGPVSVNADEVDAGTTAPSGIFADVGGWIAYGDESGIWAVDPAQPGDPDDRVRLSSKRGIPRAWSPDGSKLLILREAPNAEPRYAMDLDLFVLDADGTETRLTDEHGWVTGGSFSPDGTEVLYAEMLDTKGNPSSIYVVDAEGGTPQLLRVPSSGMYLYGSTFSPDGTQIAYFEGMGDHSHSLRVMNADGSGDRELLDIPAGRSTHMQQLAWSPDGSRLAFSGPGIWVVRADGSGLTEVIPEENHASGRQGADLHWSPDGSRLSYNSPVVWLSRKGPPMGPTLEIAHWDGTQVQKFGYGRSGPWNPLDPSTTGGGNE